MPERTTVLVHGNPETAAIWGPLTAALAELEAIGAGGSEIDVLGHDWGAGHVYGALSRRPDLVRTWAGDIAGVIHRDYVWHDMAQAWQTPGVGEQVVGGMVSSTHADKVTLFEGLGLPPAIADDLATGLDGRGHWWMIDDIAPVADSLVAFWNAN